MSRSNHTEAQMIGALKQLEAGRKAEDVAREVGVSKHTIYAWKAKYGGMDVSEAQEAKQLRDENTKLKKLVVDPSGLSAVDPSNPQSWNRYAYVLNDPLELIDLLGLGCHQVIDAEYEGGYLVSYSLYEVCDNSGGSQRTGGGGGGGGGGANCKPLTPGCSSVPTAQQQCLSDIYNSPEGKLMQFFSLASLTPLNPNWKQNWGEWGTALFGKGLGMFGSGIGLDTGIQTLNGVQNVGSLLENFTNSVLKVGEEMAPFMIAGMTTVDLMGQAQCALDPSAPAEGIPIAPK